MCGRPGRTYDGPEPIALCDEHKPPRPLHERLEWVEASQLWHRAKVGEVELHVTGPDGLGVCHGSVGHNGRKLLVVQSATADEAKAAVAAAYFAWLDERVKERRALEEEGR